MLDLDNAKGIENEFFRTLFNDLADKENSKLCLKSAKPKIDRKNEA